MQSNFKYAKFPPQLRVLALVLLHNGLFIICSNSFYSFVECPLYDWIVPFRPSELRRPTDYSFREKCSGTIQTLNWYIRFIKCGHIELQTYYGLCIKTEANFVGVSYDELNERTTLGLSILSRMYLFFKVFDLCKWVMHVQLKIAA